MPVSQILQASLASGVPSSISRAALPAGSVLQVVQTVYGTPVSTSSSTFGDTGVTASITPLYSTSKIFVSAIINGCGKSGTNTQIELRLVRGSTTLLYYEASAGYTGTTANSYWGSSALDYLDSPATTSSTTYKIQFRSLSGTGTIVVQDAGAGNGSLSSITLMEIAA